MPGPAAGHTRHRGRRPAGSHAERGQALVELALVLPFVVLLLLGVLEFGLLLDAYLAVSHAAREGARLGVVEGTGDAEIRERVMAAAPQLRPERLEIAVTPAEGQRRPGDALTVRVSYRYALVVPLFARLLGPELVLSDAFTMRVE